MESGATIHCLDIGGGVIDLREGILHAVCNRMAQFHALCKDQ